MNAYISGNAYIGKNQNDKTKIQQTSKFSADPQNLITNKHIIMKTNLFHVKTQLMKINKI
jgi:hypothetical protein